MYFKAASWWIKCESIQFATEKMQSLISVGYHLFSFCHQGESHTLVSESLIAFQAIYRVIEMTDKNLKTSYTDTLLHILFIQLLNFWNAR
jgi:hypothetical protein